MSSLLAIRAQKLFLVAVILKVVSAFLGWYFQMQWSLGFALPLVVMAAYIALGLKRQDRDVTDEKFADSCYYLGFIFTITSIVFSLFDLPSIGERIQDIAVRFGAAMVSTVAGLIVRVYLVSFRPDSSDALRNAEDTVLEAAQKFREQLVLAYEKLWDFQTQVTKATEASVEEVRLQVEKLSQDHSTRMERVFVELNERNQQAVTSALDGVRSATERMTHAVDGYVGSMQSSLRSLEDKVDAFGQAVTDRLKKTTFPDDYFASQLAGPVEQLKAASNDVSREVRAVASGVGEAAAALSAAIRKLNAKTSKAEESFDTIIRLTTAQHSLFDMSASQLEQIKQLASLLAEVQQALMAATAATAANSESNSQVQTRVTETVAAVKESERAVVAALGKVFELLDADRLAATSLAEHVQVSELATKELALELKSNSAVVQQLADAVRSESSSRIQLSGVLEAIGTQQSAICALLSSLDGKADGLSTTVSAGLVQLLSVSERLEALITRLLSSEVNQPAPVVAQSTLGAMGVPLTPDPGLYPVAPAMTAPSRSITSPENLTASDSYSSALQAFPPSTGQGSGIVQT